MTGDMVEGSTVRMRAFNLVGKKDAPLKESIANLIAVHGKVNLTAATSHKCEAVPRRARF